MQEALQNLSREQLTEIALKRLDQQKRTARKRGLEMTLELEDMMRLLQQTHCEMSGLPMMAPQYMGGQRHTMKSHLSLERYDSSKGYTKENTGTTISILNSMREMHPLDECIERAQTILMNTIGKRRYMELTQ